MCRKGPPPSDHPHSLSSGKHFSSPLTNFSAMKIRIIEISTLESGVFSCKAEEVLPLDICGRMLWFNTRVEKAIGETLDVPMDVFKVITKTTKQAHTINCLVPIGYQQQDAAQVEEEQ